MREGKIVVFVSARGGTGKSTLASLCALFGAYDQKRVALVDLDLQFGNLAFMFSKEPEKSLLDFCAAMNEPGFSPERYCCPIIENLDLYVPPMRVEQADFVLPHVVDILHALKDYYDLVVVDTGSFWTSVHVDIIDAATNCFVVISPHTTAIHSTGSLVSLLGRCKATSAKIAYLLNRLSPASEVTSMDAELSLGSSPVWPVMDGGREISDLASIGQTKALIYQKGTFLHSYKKTIHSILHLSNLSPKEDIQASLAGRKVWSR